MRKNLVLLVEGEGDVEAAPRLVKKLLTEQQAWDALALDDKSPPMRVGGLNKLLKNDCFNFKRFLEVAVKRPKTGACLVLLDGDEKTFNDAPFCPVTAARHLAAASRAAGGGSVFSVAIVFACREYESWLLAGLPSLAGQPIDNGRPGVRPDAAAPDGDLEQAPRDAKGLLNRAMESGYRESLDQAPLTSIVNLDMIRDRPMRSFRRLESALAGLASASRENKPLVTPEP